MIKILLYILCYSLLYILLLWVCGVFKSPNPTYSCNNTICSKNNTPCDTTSPNCYTNDKCNSKCKSPSDLAKEVIQEWSKKYNSVLKIINETFYGIKDVIINIENQKNRTAQAEESSNFEYNIIKM